MHPNAGIRVESINGGERIELMRKQRRLRKKSFLKPFEIVVYSQPFQAALSMRADSRPRMISALSLRQLRNHSPVAGFPVECRSENRIHFKG